MLLTPESLCLFCHHFEVVLGELKLELLFKGLYVGLPGDVLLLGAGFILPLLVVDLLDDTEHLGDLVCAHIEAVFDEKFSHLSHADGVAAVCVQLLEHVIDLLVCQDLTRSSVVLLFKNRHFIWRFGYVAQPHHHVVVLQQAPVHALLHLLQHLLVRQLDALVFTLAHDIRLAASWRSCVSLDPACALCAIRSSHAAFALVY